MTEAVIVDAVCTPVGKRNGQLKDWYPADLLAHTLRTSILMAGSGNLALAFRTQSRQTLYVTAKDPSGLLSPEDKIAAEVGQLETSLRQGRAVKFSHERNAALSAN